MEITVLALWEAEKPCRSVGPSWQANKDGPCFGMLFQDMVLGDIYGVVGRRIVCVRVAGGEGSITEATPQLRITTAFFRDCVSLGLGG